MKQFDRFDLFKGGILPGNTAFSGSSFIPGYSRSPLKTLLTIDFNGFYREFGLVAHYPCPDCYRTEALDYLNSVYKVYQRFMLNGTGEEVDRQRWQGQYISPPEGQFRMISVLNKLGNYIGDPEQAIILAERGISLPEPIDGDICSIGWSEKEKAWHGWSHRATHSFRIGDRIDSENHVCTQSGWMDEYLEQNPDKDYRLPVGFVAETNDDAKRMAIAFADSVG